MVSQTMSDKTATETEDGTRVVPIAVFRETVPYDDEIPAEAKPTYFEWSEDDNTPFRALEDIEFALLKDEWTDLREEILGVLKEANEDGNPDAKIHVANVHVHEVTGDRGVCGDYEIEWVVDVPEDAPAGRHPDDSRKDSAALADN